MEKKQTSTEFEALMGDYYHRNDGIYLRNHNLITALVQRHIWVSDLLISS